LYLETSVFDKFQSWRVPSSHIPTLTWGFVRSKAVAKERAANLSWERTWCTGLAARGRSREDLLLFKRRLTDLERLAILMIVAANDEKNRRNTNSKEHAGECLMLTAPALLSTRPKILAV
jgi:hypothetical protein